MIYIFRQYDSDVKIIIYAESYLEAKEVLFEFNGYADMTYNILEYKAYEIDMNKFNECLNIDEDMIGYPRILSNKEFELLKDNKVLLDEQFKDMHHSFVLTKKYASTKDLLSTNEYLNELQNNVVKSEKNREDIYKMLNIVGDIWIEEFGMLTDSFNTLKFYVYGRSRYQCDKIIDDLVNSSKNIIRLTGRRPELLIENFLNNLSPADIDNYNKMVKFMKDNNIKKFPFTTYKERES